MQRLVWIALVGGLFLLWFLVGPARKGTFGTPQPAVVREAPLAADEEVLRRLDSLPREEATPQSEQVEPALSKTKRVLRGVLELPSGTPSDERMDLTVTCFLDDDPVLDQHRLAVGATGEFRFAAPRECSRVVFGLVARYLIPPERMEFRADEELVLRPTLGGRIEGRITVAADPGVFTHLAIVLEDGEAWKSVRRFVDDRFGFDAVPPGEVKLAIDRPHTAIWEQGVLVRPGRTSTVEVELARAPFVEGRLVCPVQVDFARYRIDVRRMHADLQGSSAVKVYWSDRGFWTEHGLSVLPDGTFRIEGLPEGRILIGVEGPSRGSTELVCRNGGSHSIEILVEAPCEIAGSIVGPNGFVVEQHGTLIVSDAAGRQGDPVEILNGRFVAEHLEPWKSYRLEAETTPEWDETGAYGRLDSVLAPSTGVVLPVEWNGTIHGIVLGLDGQPAADATIHVTGRASTGVAGDGTFLVQAPRGNTVRLYATQSDGRGQWHGDFNCCVSAPAAPAASPIQELQVPVTGTLEDVVVRMGRGTGRLIVTLTGLEQETMYVVTVSYAPTTTSSDEEPMVLSSSLVLGEPVEFAGLPEGELTVHVRGTSLWDDTGPGGSGVADCTLLRGETKVLSIALE